ncbi:hypothetical protein E8E13_002969 [Curvularia kusanoi]|uniref:Uncharacterized protein n=1 Tax=Curvularia kusanoi TaxID=90978 RepID=A0A9P4T8E2_CURKU|nr:hypothetical protein E8E13_002969 [Curvularia kusanoi]
MTSSDTSVSDANRHDPPNSRPRSSTWTGEPPQYVSQVGSLSVLRTSIHHILASAQGTFARSAPPAFEDAQAFPFHDPYGPHRDSVENLKQQYVDSCGSLSGEKAWLQTICADQMSFFSHISITSVYEDLADGLWQDSDMTVQAKAYALRAIAGQLESNDATILSILHLLLSETGGDETAYQVHYQGLRGLIERRGGVSQLSDRLATYVIL